MANFMNLRVWQQSKDMAVRIYAITRAGEFRSDFGLTDQIRRSAVSVPSNIAEGDELETDKQAVRHFYIAKGSCAELITQVIISKEVGYISDDVAKDICGECRRISIMLTKIIKARE